jgi:hypothetical protein
MNKSNLSPDVLNQFTGTQSYARLSPWRFYLTDGTLHVATNADCFWLFNELAIAQIRPELVRGNLDLQFWTISPMAGGKGCVLLCEEDEGKPVFRKIVALTDFPFDAVPTLKVWVARTEISGQTAFVAYLPSEH